MHKMVLGVTAIYDALLRVQIIFTRWLKLLFSSLTLKKYCFGHFL